MNEGAGSNPSHNWYFFIFAFCAAPPMQSPHDLDYAEIWTASWAGGAEFLGNKWTARRF